ncbi:hypothetical protein MYVALT_G_02210 [Candidatus Vallotia tarda]|uniref:Uncharacterized protein n=1 Tax=Candidatus Vallotiella hemipterorum TaxID=1177213 RepID=A0A916JRY1_9BURK|nr:hypothetical protein MYVALT_G_02210 [Candidatus Vallotia tarda]
MISCVEAGVIVNNDGTVIKLLFYVSIELTSDFYTGCYTASLRAAPAWYANAGLYED